jgi:hypothetical protein
MKLLLVVWWFGSVVAPSIPIPNAGQLILADPRTALAGKIDFVPLANMGTLIKFARMNLLKLESVFIFQIRNEVVGFIVK